MPKGLPELQKAILQIGYQNRKAHPEDRIDTCPREVLAKFYHFVPTANITEAKTGASVFNRDAIGIKLTDAGVKLAGINEKHKAKG